MSSPATATQPEAPSAGILVALVLANFIVGTTALLPAGFLALLASDLGVSAGRAGFVIASYAFAYAVATPAFALLGNRVSARTLVIVGLAMVGVGNALAAASGSYWGHIGSRILLAIAGAAVVPTALAIAAQIGGAKGSGRTIGIAFLGITAALLLGIPAGTYLGHVIGWRGAFLLLASLACVTALFAIRQLPGALASPSLTLSDLREVLRNSEIVGLTLTVVVFVLGQFVLFTYISVYLADIGLGDAGTLSALIAVYGVAGFVGNAAAVALTDRMGARRIVICVAAGAALTFWVMTALSSSLLALTPLLFLWGLFGFAFYPAIQTRMIACRPPMARSILAVYVTANFVGQALGGTIGGIATEWFGTNALVFAAAIFASTALLAAIAVARPKRGTSGPPGPTPFHDDYPKKS